MLYGLGAPPDIIDPALRALPDCYSQELSNCLSHDNVDGLPKADCDAIVAPYGPGQDPKTAAAMDDALNNLPVCQGPSMVPWVGAAFAAGIFLSAIVLKR